MATRKAPGKKKETSLPADTSVAAAAANTEPAPPPRLRKKYADEVVPALRKEFNYGNAMQVPRLEKIVVNMGLGKAVQNPKIIEFAVEEGDCELQASRGLAHRRDGDPSPRAHVGVP